MGVDIDEFMSGLMRLRGNAKGVDMASIVFENKRLFKHLADFMKHVDHNFQRLLQVVGAEGQIDPLFTTGANAGAHQDPRSETRAGNAELHSGEGWSGL